MNEPRNDLGQTLSEFQSKVASFGAHIRRVILPVPEPLNQITDVVLAYRPKPKRKKPRKRKKVKKP